MAPEDPGAALRQIRRDVDDLITDHLASLALELAPLGADLDPLLDVLRDALGGGKRLRAAFCYWSWRAHADRAPHATEDSGRALRAGAALELFHAAALVHDDVIDASDTRRGRPAAHRAFETLHRDRGWSGDPARFGRSAAILLGDLALVAAEREMAAALAGLGAPHGDTARSIFDTMRTEVTAGQYLDVLAEVVPWGDDLAADEARTRTVVHAKSARYSVERPLALGAALAGATREDLDLLGEVGLALGEAFQLRDDLLGVFGDPAETGKPAGDDLREGKRTVLVIRALADAGPQDAALLRSGLGRSDLAAADVDAMREAVRRSGAVDQVERRIAALADPALATLAAAPLAEPGRGQLLALGRAAVSRRS